MATNLEMRAAFRCLRARYAMERKEGATHPHAASQAMLTDIRKEFKLSPAQEEKVRQHFEKWAVE